MKNDDQPTRDRERAERDRVFAQIEADAEREYQVFMNTSLKTLRRFAGKTAADGEARHP